MNWIILIIVCALVAFAVWLGLHLHAKYKRKKRVESPDPLIATTIEGTLYWPLGAPWKYILESLEQNNLITWEEYLEYIKFRNLKKELQKDDPHEYIFSSKEFYMFEKCVFTFYEGYLCGISMRFKEDVFATRTIESLRAEIAINNGKCNDMKDGRLVWACKKPCRFIILNTTDKNLSIYDMKGMRPDEVKE